MTLYELQQAVYRLSPNDQLALLETLVQALKNRQRPKSNRREIINRLRGCLKSSNPAMSNSSATDLDVKALREERIQEKYLR